MATGHSLSTKVSTELNMNDKTSTSDKPPSNGFDGAILNVAEALSNDGDVRRLGLELGIKIPDIDRALETNWAGGVKTSNGNVVMLQNWAMTVKSSKLLPTLRAALKKVGFLEIEDTCLPKSSTGEHGDMSGEIPTLRDQLKRRYRKTYSEIKTSPIDPESRTWLQHIYVTLVLMLGRRGDKEEPIDYDGLFRFIQTETPKGFATRLSFIGEAGVGKSTLFAKIALDWAEGKILQEIDLLLLESFREIEDSNHLGDVVVNHFPDDTEINGEQVDEYIKKHPRKVLILLDGLDEAKIDVKKSNRNSSLVSIVRGERFIDTPVLITTRPFGADQIKSIAKIRDQYTFIKVKGFTRENMSKYIEQYFKDDSDSASTLIEFVKTNDVVAKHMAPIPIFCCMLCYMWKTPSRRASLLKMTTLPRLFERLVFSLQEQYCSKYSDVEEGYEFHRKKAVNSLQEVGKVAFLGLLKKELIFDEQEVASEDGLIACEVGILSREKRLAPMDIRESQGKQFINEFSFPHKLLQEYTSRFYLASLFDHDRTEFDRILAEKLLKHYKEFRYVFYFTAAIGGDVAKTLMEGLCEKVNDIDFIIQVAYECQDTGDTIDPVRKLVKLKSLIFLNVYHSSNITPYLFTLETLGREVIKRGSSFGQSLEIDKSTEIMASSSYAAAVGLFTLQSLRLLVIEDLGDKDFFQGMSDAASQSKIQTMRVSFIMVTRRMLHAILSLPCLQSLNLTSLISIDVEDELILSAQRSSVVELELDGKHITSLWKLGLHTSCSQVRKLSLRWRWYRDNVSSGIVSMACSPFNLLTELHIHALYGILDIVSFCNGLVTSGPRLTKLSITGVELYNEKAAEIIQLLKAHPHMTYIELTRCFTDKDLDRVIAEVNSEGKLTVTVEHGL